MSNESSALSRRAALRQCTHWLALAAAAGVAQAPRPAHAAKLPKDDIFYQDKPKEGRKCADCKLFQPAGSGKGSCAVVEGEVSPEGWCAAFSARG